MHMETKPITLRIPTDLKKQVEKAAKADDRTVTSFVVRALRVALGEKSAVKMKESS